MIKKYTIPTILGLVVLLGGTAAGIFLIRKGPTFLLKATPGVTPKQIKVTNITDTSFTVSWITEEPTEGFVHFGQTSSLGNIATDDRDAISRKTISSSTHHVSIKNLKPKTKYYFKIGSGGKTFDNSGSAWEVTTANTPTSEVPPSDIVSGEVENQDGTPGEGAIVYLSIANMTPQSTLVHTSGNWLIALNNAFSSDLSGYASYDKQAQIIEIFVQGEEKTATAITTTGNDNPIPKITLGKNYDFRQKENSKPETEASPSGQTSEEKEATASGQQEETSSKFSFEDLGQATEDTTISIINPTEGEVLNTQKPAFSGTGPAGKTIQILLESSSAFSDTLTVDEEGNWTWSPPEELEPGEHSITISYLGKTFTRYFTVLAAGESDLPAFTATPSATGTPSPTPTPETTPTPTVSPEPTPTLETTPTPTSSPEATRTALPSTEAGVPTAGYLTPTFLLFIIGLTLSLGGIITKKILAHV